MSGGSLHERLHPSGPRPPAPGASRGWGWYGSGRRALLQVARGLRFLHRWAAAGLLLLYAGRRSGQVVMGGRGVGLLPFFAGPDPPDHPPHLWDGLCVNPPHPPTHTHAHRTSYNTTRTCTLSTAHRPTPPARQASGRLRWPMA